MSRPARENGAHSRCVRLSARLGAVAASVGRVDVAADIGSDHALVPIALIEAGMAQRAIAVEVSNGPLQIARQAVCAAGMADRISVRSGDGLAPIAEGEAQAVVIAGMGAPAIWRILTHPHALAVLAHGPLLIVQPMENAGLLRFFAQSAGMRTLRDTRVKENGFIYECLTFVLSDERQFARFCRRSSGWWLAAYHELSPELRMRHWCGEFGLLTGCRLLRESATAELKKLDGILERMAGGAGERMERRRREIQAKRAALGDLTAGLPDGSAAGRP